MKTLYTTLFMLATITNVMALQIHFDDGLDAKNYHFIEVEKDTTYDNLRKDVETAFDRKVQKMVAAGTPITDESWPVWREKFLTTYKDIKVKVFFSGTK